MPQGRFIDPSVDKWLYNLDALLKRYYVDDRRDEVRIMVCSASPPKT